jgi:WD40 repeat protein
MTEWKNPLSGSYSKDLPYQRFHYHLHPECPIMNSGISAGLILFLFLIVPASASSILWSETTYQDITDLSITADGSAVVAAGGLVHYFTQDGMLEWRLWGVDYATISADGRYIGGAIQGTAMLLDTQGRRLWDRPIDGLPSAFSLSEDGDKMVVGVEGRLYFFDNSGELLGTYPDRNEEPWRQDFVDASTSRDGYYSAAITERSVFFFNRSGYRLWQELNYTLLDGHYVAIAPNGHEVAAIGDAELFYLHSGGETLWTRRTNSDITTVAFAGDGQTLALGTEDGGVYLLSRDGTVLGTFQAQKRITSVSLSSDGARVLASSWDGNVYLLSGDGTLLSIVNTPDTLYFAALSSDGTWGAAASKIRVYYLSLVPEVPKTTLPTTVPTTPPTTTMTTTTQATSATSLPPTETTTVPTTETTVPTTTEAGMPMEYTLGLIVTALTVVLWRIKPKK